MLSLQKFCFLKANIRQMLIDIAHRDHETQIQKASHMTRNCTGFLIVARISRKSLIFGFKTLITLKL